MIYLLDNFFHLYGFPSLFFYSFSILFDSGNMTEIRETELSRNEMYIIKYNKKGRATLA